MTEQHHFGFWSALGDLRLRYLISAEVLTALVVGAGGGVGLAIFATEKDRLALSGDFLLIVGPLLGVAFAGFALVIALMSDTYVRWLNTNENGARAFLSPFLIAAGILTGELLATVAYRGIAGLVPQRIEQVAFCLLAFGFVLSVMQVPSLARNVMAHGTARAESVGVEDLERLADKFRERREQKS